MPATDGKALKLISLDARESGVPIIVGNCLYIGDTVVIWTSAQLATLPDLVRAARAGVTTPIVVGGGGIGVREGADYSSIPREIRDRCSVESIWYASGATIHHRTVE